MADLLSIHPGAGVLHGDLHPAVHDVGSQRHPPPITVVLDRVADQVVQALQQLGAVGQDLPPLRELAADVDTDAAGLGHQPQHVGALVQHGVQRHGAELQRHRPRLDALDVQHLVDEGQQAVRGGLDVGDMLALAGIDLQLRIGGQQLRKAEHRVQRGAHLVAHAGEEGALGLTRTHRQLALTQGLFEGAALADIMQVAVPQHRTSRARLGAGLGFDPARLLPVCTRDAKLQAPGRQLLGRAGQALQQGPQVLRMHLGQSRRGRLAGARRRHAKKGLDATTGKGKPELAISATQQLKQHPRHLLGNGTGAQEFVFQPLAVAHRHQGRMHLRATLTGLTHEVGQHGQVGAIGAAQAEHTLGHLAAQAQPGQHRTLEQDARGRAQQVAKALGQGRVQRQAQHLP